MSIFNDPNFDEILAGIIYDSRVQSPDCDLVTEDELEWEDDDGQPSLYDEWQDFYGGDDYVEQWEEDYGDY